jgi:hypothetical protein
VSDYDLLALDQLGQTKNDKQLFPQADETWQVRHAPELHTQHQQEAVVRLHEHSSVTQGGLLLCHVL